jgi:SAM-dependent methyltransferase
MIRRRGDLAFTGRRGGKLSGREPNRNDAPPVCVCTARMVAAVAPWSYRCPACGSWASSLEPAIGSAGAAVAAARIDESNRERGLAQLRQQNFAKILDLVGAIRPSDGMRLLDVGSAHGWFLEAAAARGFRALGIEPDAAVADAAVKHHPHEVRGGYFPDVLAPAETFDLVSFNDVLEHLPNPAAALRAAFDHLGGDGLLSINIPSAEGILFRLSRLLGALGIRAPYARLWQVGLPSPHLWFFTRASLTELAQRCGFVVVHSGSLPTLTRPGLWQRIHLDRRPSLITAVAFGLVWLGAPLLNAKRFADIMLLVFVKPAAGQAAAT